MKMKVSKGPYPFYIPKSRDVFNDIQALMDLADVNGLFAVDIMKKANDSSNGIWKEMMESVGLDVCDMPMEAAEVADIRNQSRFRHLQSKIQKRNERLGLVDRVDDEDVSNDLSVKKEKGSRASVMGHPVTAVLRWMGKELWGFEEAKSTLKRLDISPADATIRAQLRAGLIGTRGEPADLTLDQQKTLENFCLGVEKQGS